MEDSELISLALPETESIFGNSKVNTITGKNLDIMIHANQILRHLFFVSNLQYTLMSQAALMR